MQYSPHCTAQSVDDNAVVIGLVNNMAPRAMRATECQFRDLMHTAAAGRAIRFELYTVHDFPVQPGYRSLDALWPNRLDGLVVTGLDPRAPRLSDEPAWPSLTKLVDWAERHCVPTVWSCFAAHAAVLHLDNISRVRLPAKVSGLFDCDLVSTSHSSVNGMPARFAIPHSRHNGLDEDELRAGGYEILSRSDAAGVDMFVREGRARFLFCQGHPEYGTDTLLREYLRDMRRYLDGEKELPGEVPANYLDSATEIRLSAVREAALRERDGSLMAESQHVARDAVFMGDWRPAANAIYAGWLAAVVKGRRQLAA